MSDNNKIQNFPHDALVKKCFSQKEAARELLDRYLPEQIKSNINLNTLKIEKESYVEDNLKHKISDLVYSMLTNDKKPCLVYTIVEHQSTPDYWIAFRLWKYTLLLLERHVTKKNKLPIVIPVVIYNGKQKYNAPTSFWQLFQNPEQAQNIMCAEYKLLNISTMTQEEIKKHSIVNLSIFYSPS